MSLDFEKVRINLSEVMTVRVILHLAQIRCRVRVLTVNHLDAASGEAERVLHGLGLTKAERVGVRIEVSASDRKSSRGEPMATFAELERTRSGWRLNRIARRVNRVARTSWLATALPTHDVLVRAAERSLRRGTSGIGRL